MHSVDIYTYFEVLTYMVNSFLGSCATSASMCTLSPVPPCAPSHQCLIFFACLCHFLLECNLLRPWSFQGCLGARLLFPSHALLYLFALYIRRKSGSCICQPCFATRKACVGQRWLLSVMESKQSCLPGPVPCGGDSGE